MTAQDPDNSNIQQSGATTTQEPLGFDDFDESELVEEFGDYKSLDDDDDRLSSSSFPSMKDSSSLTPKERRILEMRLEARIEAIIFASQKPLKASEVLEIMGDPSVTERDVEKSLEDLVEFYESRSGGFRLHYLKRLGYQFQTSDDAAAIMERMFASRPRPISRAALETLAIIAYRQPVTRAEVEFIRGVDAGSIFKTLLERDLIKCTGRKEIVGRPMLFGTTDEFLKVFNLSSVKDLPSLESFQPSRELVQGARERLAEGHDDLVDVETYISEQMGESAQSRELDEADDRTDHSSVLAEGALPVESPDSSARALQGASGKFYPSAQATDAAPTSELDDQPGSGDLSMILDTSVRRVDAGKTD